MNSEFIGQITTLLGVIFGSLLTWFVTRYQLNKSAELARNEKWTNELAMLLAEFLGKCYALTFSLIIEPKGAKEEVKLMEEIGALRFRLLLILNPECKEQKHLADCICEVSNCAMSAKDEKAEKGRESISTKVKIMLEAARVFTTQKNINSR